MSRRNVKIHMESSGDMIGSNREKFVNYEKYRLTVRKRCAILTITKMIIITDLEKCGSISSRKYHFV